MNLKEVAVLANIDESVEQPFPPTLVEQPFPPTLTELHLYSASLVVVCSTGITFPYLNANELEGGINELFLISNGTVYFYKIL